MSDDNDVKPLLVEIRDIVLRHEEVNRKEAEFRKRVMFALLFALVVAVLAMGYALLIVHTTIKDIRQRQEQLQPQKVAALPCEIKGGTTNNSARASGGTRIQPRMKQFL